MKLTRMWQLRQAVFAASHSRQTGSVSSVWREVQYGYWK